MHYHHGFFLPEEPAGAGFEEAMDRAVTSLFPFIPKGGRVLDVGSGWCGPLAMLQDLHGCEVVGVTICDSQ